MSKAGWVTDMEEVSFSRTSEEAVEARAEQLRVDHGTRRGGGAAGAGGGGGVGVVQEVRFC